MTWMWCWTPTPAIVEAVICRKLKAFFCPTIRRDTSGTYFGWAAFDIVQGTTKKEAKVRRWEYICVWRRGIDIFTRWFFFRLCIDHKLLYGITPAISATCRITHHPPK